MIHQRVENQTNINLSKSKNIITVDNEEIDRGWNGVKTQKQRNLVRRHIVSDSRGLRNSHVVDVTKSKAVTDLNQIEESKKSLSLAERKRQALTLNKSNQDRTTQAHTTQTQKEDQRKITTHQQRDRLETAQRKAEEEKAKQARDSQKQIEDQKKSLSLAERKRQALTLNKSNQVRTTKAQTCLLYTSPSPRDQRGSGLEACAC